MRARREYASLVVGRVASSFDPPEPDPTEDAPSTADELFARIEAWRRRDEGLDDVAAVSDEEVLLRYAPAALVEGSWLLPLLRVERSHDALGAACIDAHFVTCGSGDAGGHRANRYRASLGIRGLSLPEITSPSFVADRRLADEDFELALSGLRLASSARVGEILGFHAASVTLGPPPAAHRAGAPSFEPTDRALAHRCITALPEPIDRDALWRGATRALDARERWRRSLSHSRPSVWERMIALVQAKAPYARGHHSNIRIGSRTLQAWLDPNTLDAPAFLSALASSRFVVPGRPDESRLTSTTIRFGGPMFAVFNPSELDLLRAWILALPTQPAPPLTLPASRPVPVPVPVPVPDFPSPSGSRALYRALLRHPESAPTVHQAETFVTTLLCSVRRSVTEERLEKDELWPYSKDRLQRWVDRTLAAATLPELGSSAWLSHVSREDALFILVQLTPAAFVDGAWAAGAMSPACSHTPAAARLFDIYRDELGSGVPRQHHGNVMRRTLEAQGIHLPACDDASFSSDRRFLSDAFELPALWLAIAQHTRTFFPELLGLNLAIEMAGLGDVYRTAAAVARRHGIDPYFFDLHNTIDNAASGHTRWSVDAIVFYLDELGAKGGEEVVGRAWLRLWEGFATYAKVNAPLLRAIALRLAPKLALRRLGASLRKRKKGS